MADTPTTSVSPTSPMNRTPVVLVVDDDKYGFPELACRALQQAGYETAQARSAPEALQYLAESKPCDGVLTDYDMAADGQATSGAALASALKKSHPDLPVVLMTSIDETTLARATRQTIASQSQGALEPGDIFSKDNQNQAIARLGEKMDPSRARGGMTS